MQIWLINYSHKHGADVMLYSSEAKRDAAASRLIRARYLSDGHDDSCADAGAMLDALANAAEYIETDSVEVDPDDWW